MDKKIPPEAIIYAIGYRAGRESGYWRGIWWGMVMCYVGRVFYDVARGLW